MIMIGYNNNLEERRKNKEEINKKGSILAYVLVMMAIVSIILVSMLQYVSSQLKFSFNRVEKEKAFQVAEAGIYFYRWYLAHEVSGKTAQQIKVFWASGSPYGVASPYEAEFFDPEGGAIGKYKIEVVAPDPDSTIVTVKSTGWTYKEPNMKRIIQARFRRPSWSEYSVLADAKMRFGPGTIVTGKVHSNQGIRFDGLANNIISSLPTDYDDEDHSGANEHGVHTHVNAPPGSGINNNFRPLEAPPSPVANRSDVFQAGRKLGVPEVDFNGVISDLNFMKSEAQAGNGKYFDSTGGGRRIILKTDGTYDACTVNAYDSTSYGSYGSFRISSYIQNDGSGTCSSCSGYASNGCATNYPIVNKGIIFVEDNAWVEGIIDNKKVTIVAANLGGGSQADIFIGLNNILYTNFDGKDIIGLIAQRNVSVIRDSVNVFTVDAALLAQSGRVGRGWYPSAYNKNTITVNGSLATNLRYGFAYTDGTGYTNRILNFDNNLLYYPPPYFPTGTEYSIDLWDEL